MKNIILKAIAIIISIIVLASLTACQDEPALTPLDDAAAHVAPGESTPEASTSGAAPTRPRPPDFELEPDPVEVERIVVQLNAEQFARGTNVIPEVIILPEDAADKTFTLTSEDTSVLRRRSGRWAAVGVGTTQLVATAPNGVVGRATVTVYAAVDTIVLGAAEITIHSGERVAIVAEVLPEDAADKELLFTSEDESIATVTGDGTVIAVGQGTTTISVTSGEIEETVTVNVIAAVTAINVTTDQRAYQVGDEGRLFIRIVPEGAPDPQLTVTLSGNEIRLTGEDTFLAIAPGDVTITVTSANGVVGSETISVINLNDFAEEVFRLTNIEREIENLSPFTSTEPLRRAALLRAEEITEYFSHTRPDGRDCFTAFTESGVDYLTAGENLAAGHRTPSDVVRGWMNSPGHRENIVNPAFGRMGVGIVMDETGRIYWTQAFTD